MPGFREMHACDLSLVQTNKEIIKVIPLSLGLALQFPAVWIQSPAMFSSFFQSDFTHLSSHPSVKHAAN